jgi:hypothetical protein
MFRLWLLKLEKRRALTRIRAVQRKTPKGILDEAAHASFKKELDKLDAINFQIDSIRSNELVQQALDLDIKVAYDDPECWGDHEFHGIRFHMLTPHGRSVLRPKIDAEKARRFEVKTLWVTKFWLPLLAALVGIIGALTGLFAVMHRNPVAPEKKPPVYELPVQVKATKK